MTTATQPEHVYRLFFHPGEVVEIRVAGLKGERKGVWEGRAWGADAWVFGYFDNETDFAEAVRKLDTAGAAFVYFTPNPPRPELIHRVRNRLVVADKKRTLTSNHEVRCIRWLLIDLDPSKAVRPAGISSSDEELEAVAELGKEIKTWLGDDLDFPDPIGGMSGNGYHLVYRLPDLPNEVPRGQKRSEASMLVKGALEALAHRFQDPRVDVDQTVHNAARIWKLYGTVARKGESSEERPHRRSYLFSSAPESLEQVEVVSRKQLKRLVSMAPEDSSRPAPSASSYPVKTSKPGKKGKTRRYKHDLGDLDVPAWLSAYGRAVHSVEQDGSATRFILEECVFDSSHKAKDACIVQVPNEPLRYHCFHNSCEGLYFKDARRVISGEDSLKPFMTGYDPSQDRPKETQYAGKGELACINIEGINTDLTDPLESLSGLSAPGDIDPAEFFTMSYTNRPRFTVKLMANYLAAYLGPICCTSGQFWRYSGGVWKQFSTGKLSQMIVCALKEKIQPEWINGSIKVLEGLVNREEKEWPQYPHLINVKNGMVDLSGITVNIEDAADLDLEALLKPHDPKYGSRVQLDVEYDLDATNDIWYQTLNEIFPDGRPVEAGRTCLGDEKIKMLKQFGGYVLLNTTKYEKCLVCYGAGANGKGTVMDAFAFVIGEENATELSIEDLGKSFNLPYLQTKMMVTCAELPQKDSGGGVQKLKQCISGDMMSGELKFGKRVDFRNKAKFIFSMNLPPTISDKSYGFYRKILVLNFNRRFEDHEFDRDRREKIREHKNGVFLWMLDGAVDLIRSKGFTETEGTVREKNLFFKAINPMLLYVEEQCRVDKDDEQLYVPKTELHEDYQQWCKKTLHKPLGRTNFYLQIETHCRLKEARREVDRGGITSTPRCYVGIGLI